MIENKMPVMFVGHGSPLNAIEDGKARRGWQEMGQRLEAPKVIIAISAHWTSEGKTLVRTAEVNRQINDMYGFPEELYAVHYEPKGNPELARQILEDLGEDGKEDNTWGIDHGVWSILCNMFPEENVPVVMMSIDTAASPAKLMEIGKKLAKYRQQGAMILASGNVVHNLYQVSWEMDYGYTWATSFDVRMMNLIKERNFEGVGKYKELSFAAQAVPTEEHFLPLLVALGAVEDDDEIEVFNEYREIGSISMTSYKFG